MRKLLTIAVLAAVFGAWQQGYLAAYWPSMNSGSFDKDGKPQLIVFTHIDCGLPCQKVRDDLQARNAPFREVRLSSMDKGDPKVQFWERHGRGDLPYVVAGHDTLSGTSGIMLAALLAKNFGETYLSATQKRYFKRHFDSQGRAQVVMYGADWCGYCRKLGQQLKEAGIDYLEIDVPKSGEKTLMTQTMEIPGYPSVWVGYTRIRQSTSVRQIRLALKG